MKISSKFEHEDSLNLIDQKMIENVFESILFAENYLTETQKTLLDYNNAVKQSIWVKETTD